MSSSFVDVDVADFSQLEQLDTKSKFLRFPTKYFP